MTIKVAIVDDESIARARLRRLLGREPGVRVIADCANGAEAIDAIMDRRPDVVFLDVQMPECDGFQVVQAVGENDGPLIVFVTAYDEYAVRAFDANAIDYLLKPFDGVRLQRTLNRVRERLGFGRDQAPASAVLPGLHYVADPVAPAASLRSVVQPSRYRTNFLIRAGGRLRMLPAREVDSIESAANYARLHVRNAEFLIRETITSLSESLDPELFVRIHRRTIVNISRILEIEPWFSGDALIVLKDGRKLRLSRSYHRTFYDALGRK